MTTADEMQQLGAGRFGDDLRASGIAWTHLPVTDFGAPSEATDRAWKGVSAAAANALLRGGRVLAHCRGGCGRSGMIVLRLMVEHGEDADAALSRLRRVRSCAVETDGQMEWAMRPGQAR
ncbi:protein-tyrosine phosphatase family protein [Ruegeria sp.]|uniref:protein-tyrosine phosphatase family protein n=1 Tax=Ruegeria sp. TaxID=1879320 RepID=UPI003B5AB90D